MRISYPVRISYPEYHRSCRHCVNVRLNRVMVPSPFPESEHHPLPSKSDPGRFNTTKRGMCLQAGSVTNPRSGIRNNYEKIHSPPFVRANAFAISYCYTSLLLAVAGAKPNVEEVFKLTLLDRVFNLYEDIDSALAGE